MDKPLFSFSVLSDLHFMAYKDTHLPVDWVPMLHREIDYIFSLRPSFIVVNGDLTNGKERDYRLAASAFNDRGAPVYYTMGNHEYYGVYEDDDFTPEAAQQRFLHFTGAPAIYYELHAGDFTFLFLSTENYLPEHGEAAWLGKAQLDWLEAKLATAGKRPVFAFLHHPVNNTVADSSDTCVQSEQLRTILHQFPGIILFTGHTHCRMDRADQIVRQNGTVFVGGGCMYQQFPQSRFVDVYSDRAVIRLIDHTKREWLNAFEETILFERLC